MRKALVVLTICSVLVLGGLVTTYIYLNYTARGTYENGIFVNKEVKDLYETDYCLHQTV